MSMLIGEILDNSVREHRDVTAVQWLKNEKCTESPMGNSGSGSAESAGDCREKR